MASSPARQSVETLESAFGERKAERGCSDDCRADSRVLESAERHDRGRPRFGDVRSDERAERLVAMLGAMRSDQRQVGFAAGRNERREAATGKTEDADALGIDVRAVGPDRQQIIDGGRDLTRLVHDMQR